MTLSHNMCISIVKQYSNLKFPPVHSGWSPSTLETLERKEETLIDLFLCREAKEVYQISQYH